MKVLVSAYACQPGQGSEPGVGWNVVEQLARSHRVWVLTRRNNRPAIEAELAERPQPNLHFIYLDVLGWGERWPPGQIGRTVRLHYYAWQQRTYLAARRLHEEVGFDLAHHVTYVQYGAPSLLALLPIPFVWGPVGGAETAPASFRPTFDRHARTYETLRDASRWVAERDPFVRLTARRSAVALAMTEDTERRLRALGAGRVELRGESGMRREEIERLGRLPPPLERPVRFVSIGRLLHWKGFYLGLQAFAAARLDDAEYWVIGDGPERTTLERIAREAGLLSRVRFLGKLPRDEVLTKMADCHVLVHPSLHDSGGWVCLEAMAAGRPVICLDLGGPATQVTEATGFKVPAQAPAQVVRDMAEVMRRLAGDPELRAGMASAGRARVLTEYEWRVKGRFFDRLYQDVLDHASSRLSRGAEPCAS